MKCGPEELRPPRRELIQQHSDAPSCYRDSYAPGEEGFHHVAILCEDHRAACQRYADAGIAVAMQIGTGEQRITYMDARESVGVMIELYPDTEGIRGLFEMVRGIGRDWDGKTLIWAP